MMLGSAGTTELFYNFSGAPQTNTWYPKALADKLAVCHFEFLQPDVNSPEKPSVWVQRWVKPLLPAAIRVVMAPLDPQASQLPLATLTIPVRVNRDPSVDYANAN